VNFWFGALCMLMKLGESSVIVRMGSVMYGGSIVLCELYLYLFIYVHFNAVDL
jgi:hypothetical protein